VSPPRAEPGRTVGERLRAARRQKGLTEGRPWLQRDVAQALGVDPVTVSRWETGQTSPGAAQLQLLAEHLGVSVESFFAGRPATPIAKDARAARRPAGPDRTFESFVDGPSNALAAGAARAVAAAPGQTYNPLFIYAPTGLGKTHLLHAIAFAVDSEFPDLSVRYVSSETFVNDFINSLRDKHIEGFKQRYRTYDVLLIDDIQFLEHKERIQEEFFHTFNALHDVGHQLVLSSDRLPRDIAKLEERLRSRFESGLVVRIEPPDLDTRIAILRQKVARDGIHLEDDDVLSIIAGRVSTNIRDLGAALTRVHAFASLTGRTLDSELARDVLQEVYPEGEAAPEASIDRIQRIVSAHFGVSAAELVGRRRAQNVAFPRQVAMFLSRELTDRSLQEIGEEFGGREHTTVIHTVAKVGRLVREDTSASLVVDQLKNRIRSPDG
jgi:chromosomal replication initiator protein